MKHFPHDIFHHLTKVFHSFGESHTVQLRRTILLKWPPVRHGFSWSETAETACGLAAARRSWMPLQRRWTNSPPAEGTANVTVFWADASRAAINFSRQKRRASLIYDDLLISAFLYIFISFDADFVIVLISFASALGHLCPFHRSLRGGSRGALRCRCSILAESELHVTMCDEDSICVYIICIHNIS